MSTGDGFILLTLCVSGGLHWVLICRFGTYSTSDAIVAGLDIEIINIVPVYGQRLFLLVDGNRQPDVATLPERVGVPLVSEVQICRLLAALDAQTEARLRAERAGVKRRNDEGLGPGAA